MYVPDRCPSITCERRGGSVTPFTFPFLVLLAAASRTCSAKVFLIQGIHRLHSWRVLASGHAVIDASVQRVPSSVAE